MGKRKSAAKPPPKRSSGKVPTIFDCPFCNHEKVVECKIDVGNRKGAIVCTKCAVTYETVVDNLSKPIDVYCDWIDACEKANAPGEAE